MKKVKAANYLYYDVHSYPCTMMDEDEMFLSYADYGYLRFSSKKDVVKAVTKMLTRFNSTILVVDGKLFAPPVRMYCELVDICHHYMKMGDTETAEFYSEQCKRMYYSFYSDKVDEEAQILIYKYLD